MRELLVLGISLLEVARDEPMSTAQWMQTLEEMQEWGKSHHGHFLPGAADDERLIFFSGLADHEEHEPGSAVRRAQQRKQISGHGERIQAHENIAEAAPITVQLNGMNFVPCYDLEHQMSTLDKLRVAVEDYLDEVVDWWPLRPLTRPQKAQHTELRWEVSKRYSYATRNICQANAVSVRRRGDVDHSKSVRNRAVQHQPRPGPREVSRHWYPANNPT